MDGWTRPLIEMQSWKGCGGGIKGKGGWRREKECQESRGSRCDFILVTVTHCIVIYDVFFYFLTSKASIHCGPLARPFTHSLAPFAHTARSHRSFALLTCSLAPPYLLCSHAPLCSLVCLLAHFAHSLARGTVNDSMAIYSVFFVYSGPKCNLDHSEITWDQRLGGQIDLRTDG